MNKKGVALVILLSVFIGASLLGRIQEELGVFDGPADRYTVAELQGAIATREANFAERAVELEGEK